MLLLDKITDMGLKDNIKFLFEKPKNRCNSRYIRLHYPEEYQKIISLPFSSFKEQLYNYIYDCPEHKCLICGRPTSFTYLGRGYLQYCSTACSYKSIERQNNFKHTMLERYGVENSSFSDELKDKKLKTITKNYGGFGFASKKITERRNKTLIERYGTTNTSSVPEIQEKIRKTMKEHFGVDHFFQTEISRSHLKKAIRNKYGVDNMLQLPEIQEKVAKTNRNKALKKYDFINEVKEGSIWTIKCPHPDCNKCQEKQFEIYRQRYWERKMYGAELCTKLLPVARNYSSIEIKIRQILDKYNINYEVNPHNIISPKEVDIYISDKQIAIECNGIFWHSTINKYTNYHYEKFKACQEKGIQLLTFWEDQIVNKPQIIESLLCSKLGIYNYSIGARQCRIQEITYQESSSFIDSYHLQGSTKSKIRIGLFYNDELVSVMTFSHRKGCQGRGEVGWILDRYCVKAGYKISGGASRLLTYFIRKYQPESITSFASNDISNGNLYEQLGFTKSTVSGSYWYIDTQMHRYHRSSFTKAAIVRRGWKESISKDWTEAQVLREHNFFKIYDTGTTKYMLKFS